MKRFANCILLSVISIIAYANERNPINKTTVPNSFFAKEQPLHVNTKEANQKMGKAIPYPNISVTNTPIGISSNEVGKFVIAPFQEGDTAGSIFHNRAEKTASISSNTSRDPIIKALSGQMDLHSKNNPTEKVFLHTDKDMYSSGEQLWYSAYVVMGPDHHFTTASKVLHVDLIGPDNMIIESQTHELIDGRGSGSLQIPENLSNGYYQLRSYTQWMRNFDSGFFFTKNLRILNEAQGYSNGGQDKMDLQFFPESGQMVASVPGKVAFKAIGGDGLDKKAKGTIVNSEGKSVATLSTFGRGAGFFQLLPKAGEQYTAVLDDGTRYPLPKVMAQGYVLTISNLDEKSFRVNVQASEFLADKPFYLVAQMRQRRYYHGKFEFGAKPMLSIEIPKTKMSSGILTITLFDENKRPWCERAIFVNNQEALVITTKIDHENLAKRERINLKVRVTDMNGRPISTDLSVAVTDFGQVVKNQYTGNAITNILLQSDIKGHVANPGLLFKDQKRSTLQALDLVMLTHAWRKFNWPEILDAKNQKKNFDVSKGLTLSGRAQRLNGKIMPNTALNIVAKSEERLAMFSTRTFNDGKFLIPDFNFSGETKIVFNALNSLNKPVNVKVTLDNNSMGLPLPQFRSPSFKIPEKTEDYLAYASARIKMDSIYNFKNITKLDEVVVTDKKISQAGSPSTYGHRPDAALFTADHISAHTVLDLVRRFSGVSITGNAVSIRNRGTPLWVLDGIPINQGVTSSSLEGSVTAAPAPSLIATMDTFTVERVELLKGPRAAIWGSRGGNGVILIYTKRGVGRTVKPVSSPDFMVMGHAAEREFYIPKYDTKHDEHDAPDYRATLYWNPNFTTDKDGNANLVFYNSDNAQQIQVHIEGLSAQGAPGTHLQTFGGQVNQ